jgi:signal transduction histidine kinase
VQAVLNIALNAVEAMPQGGTLTLSAKVIDTESSPRIEIAIEDTGEGIEKKAMKSLFKPFYTTKETGTGIGLAISQQIVKAHGGTIDVTSSPGRGSVFHIRIPVHDS